MCIESSFLYPLPHRFIFDPQPSAPHMNTSSVRAIVHSNVFVQFTLMCLAVRSIDEGSKIWVYSHGRPLPPKMNRINRKCICCVLHGLCHFNAFICCPAAGKTCCLGGRLWIICCAFLFYIKCAICKGILFYEKGRQKQQKLFQFPWWLYGWKNGEEYTCYNDLLCMSTLEIHLTHIFIKNRMLCQDYVLWIIPLST